MRRFAFLLCGCLCAAAVSAAEVQVFTEGPPAKSDTSIRRAELAIVNRAVATLRRSGTSSPTQTIPVTRVVEYPARNSGATVLPARALPVAAPAPAASSEFTFKDRNGKVVAAPIVDRYQKDRIVSPLGKGDPRINPKLTRAASIAQERAHAHSKSRCWRYVKNALLASGIIGSYPKTAYAKEAGEELVRDYGFKKLPIRDPYKAPVGAVLVYGSRRAAGHVEIRTKTGFVSDFQNKKPSRRPLLGVYAKA